MIQNNLIHGKVSNYFILEGNDLCEISIDADDKGINSNIFLKM